ncbi:hypothetical protein C8Q74DRAFT_1215055 [Fomes fomentarius]|nr:hypothetical protein C8Q74DRAFT_1215055 [Fomes fomentarius]
MSFDPFVVDPEAREQGMRHGLGTHNLRQRQHQHQLPFTGCRYPPPSWLMFSEVTLEILFLWSKAQCSKTLSKPTSQCQALEPDEKTRCSSKPLKGLYHCRIHHPQYQTLTKRYKEVQGVVDGMEGTPLFSAEEIARIKDMHQLQAEYHQEKLVLRMRLF